MPWTYFRRKPNGEHRAGLYRHRWKAEQERDFDEALGQPCSSVYWSNRWGTCTARGKVNRSGILERIA